ncbi:hypothetical protein AGRA3207_005362 [Actinomadura graeca]|uniref:DUF4190 domain-containing protein n=1 Tax=Actinomadura graeca TaxID=2750812 RepID=A0ABX8QZ73_9ACTN|nr:hypothetical protein [Actinomadura graeca]QXJ24105.1 hypothetical protein AGRA3207_005362 [Actinomadura graeca]
MSGYGGSPPPGWEDPYGGSQGWGGGGYGPPPADPYGQGPPPGYGYGYGPPGVPYAPAGNGSTIAALICNIVAIVLCCNIVAIPGVILAAIAMGRAQSDPYSARRLTMWSWVLFGASIVVAIIVMVAWIVLAANSEPDYGSSSGI